MTSFLKKLQHYLMFLFLKSIIPLFIIIRLWHSYTLIQPFISGKFTWQQKNSGGFIKFPPLFRGMTPWCFLHSWHEQVGKVLQRKAYSTATKRFWNYQIVRVAICLYVIPESVKLRTIFFLHFDSILAKILAPFGEHFAIKFPMRERILLLQTPWLLELVTKFSHITSKKIIRPILIHIQRKLERKIKKNIFHWSQILMLKNSFLF